MIMAMHVSAYALGVAACVLITLATAVYRSLLPKPIPGVPYNKASARRILGDVPDVGNSCKCRNHLL